LIQSIINENESLESIIGHIIGFTILGYLLISNPTISDYFPTAITIDEFYYGNNNEFGQAENADLNEFVSSKKSSEVFLYLINNKTNYKFKSVNSIKRENMLLFSFFKIILKNGTIVKHIGFSEIFLKIDRSTIIYNYLP
jgi:hypothetical protein